MSVVTYFICIYALNGLDRGDCAFNSLYPNVSFKSQLFHISLDFALTPEISIRLIQISGFTAGT